MTDAHCETQLHRLGILKGTPDEIVEYFAALKDVPDGLFTAAVDHALKTRAWFPTPAELRLDCDVANAANHAPAFEAHVQDVVGGGRDVTITNTLTGQALTLHVVREWKFDCEDCRDSGWREEHCPELHCGRRFEHAPHPYVVPCHCCEWNPTVRRRKEAGAKYSKQPAKVA